VTQVAVGGYDACALLVTKRLECWGSGAQGQLGDGNTSSSDRPVSVDGLSAVVSLTVGFGHDCAIESGDILWCWGDDAVVTSASAPRQRHQHRRRSRFEVLPRQGLADPSPVR
jgi:alpha-tubulin suppressor-like RCC1 family protein